MLCIEGERRAFKFNYLYIESNIYRCIIYVVYIGEESEGR
jgi:hypothetical protein